MKQSPKREFDDILASVVDFVNDTKPETILDEIKEDITQKASSDFELMRQVCHTYAKEFINNLVKFYLDGEILNDLYVQKRMEDDIDTIADLKNQMATSQYAITKLLEVIEGGGATYAKNFEVLSMLQKSKMEIVKHYEAVKTNIENNYRHFKTVYDQNHAEEMEVISETTGYGTKALLDNLELNLDAQFLNPAPKSEELGEDDYMDEKEYKPLPKGVKYYDATDTGQE